MWWTTNDGTQRIMRSDSPSASPTWRHALTIPEEEEARMVLTFEWESACPLLFCWALGGQRGCKRRTFITSVGFFLDSFFLPLSRQEPVELCVFFCGEIISPHQRPSSSR